jgi:hypothetical protein
MTQEDKELLLKDLCARLPYGVKVQVADYKTPIELSHIDTKNGNGRKPYCFVFAFEPERVKPYLRPMSSMTKEENKKYYDLCDIAEVGYYEFGELVSGFNNYDTVESIDYLNSIHVDYRGLIPKGLAIEVTKENNPYKV